MKISNKTSAYIQYGCIRNSKRKNLSNISVSIALFLAFCSMQPWFAWRLEALSLIMLLFMMIRMLISGTHPLIPKKQALSIFIFFLFGIIYSRPTFAPFYDTLRIFITIVLPCICVILFSIEEKIQFLRWFITLFCIILAFSIPAFFFHSLGISSPYVIIQHPNPFYDSFQNHYLFITSNSFLSGIRFNSIYTEPGHLGMMCAILLYVNKFTLKDWKNVVMFIALLWSLSLSGYLLAFIGFIAYKIASSKNIWKLFLLLITIIGSLLYLILNYDNQSTDIISVKILSRMQFNSETGISGNNRNTDDFLAMYERYRQSSDYLLGISSEKYHKLTDGTPNSSYKNFILANGILATVLLWMFLFEYCKRYPSKFGFGFLVLLFFCFIQRPYIMWSAQIYTAICAIPYFNIKKIINL